MSSFPLISVIIPTYNRRNLLVSAVESCLDQTYGAYEIIIVDDGSTDDTASLIHGLLQGEWTGRGIQYVCQKNGGASSARNYGLSLAKGEYVQFLDSDDILLPEKLSLQVAKLQRNKKAKFCYCYGMLVEEGSVSVKLGVFNERVAGLL